MLVWITELGNGSSVAVPEVDPRALSTLFPSTTGGDPHLVAAASAGDPTSLDTLLRRHYDRIHALCRRITGSTPTPLDAAQEALIAIVRGLDRFDDVRRSPPGPTASPPTRPSTSCGGAGGGRSPSRPTTTRGQHARRRPTQSWPRIDVDAALAELPTEFRVAVVLRDLCGLSYDEIAEAVEIPPGRSAPASPAAGPCWPTGSATPIAGNSAPTLERPTP